MEWCRDIGENKPATTEITVITEESDLKALLGELNAFYQPEQEKCPWEKINPTTENTTFGYRQGLYFYNKGGQLLHRMTFTEKNGTASFNVYKGEQQLIKQYANSRPIGVLNGILQGIYDKWAQKYPMFYLATENIRSVLLLDNNTRESVVLASADDIAAFNDSLKQLKLQAPTAMPQGISICDGPCQEVRVSLYDGSLCVYHLYQGGIAAAAGSMDVDLMEKAYYQGGGSTYDQFLSSCHQLVEKKEHHISWLTMLEQKKVTVLEISRSAGASGGGTDTWNIETDSGEATVIIALLKRLEVPNGESKEFLPAQGEDRKYKLTFTMKNAEISVYIGEDRVAVGAKGYTGASYRPDREGMPRLLNRLEVFSRPINPPTGQESGEKYNPPLAKPVIYLYPEQEKQVNVQLNFSGKLTYTYPSYPQGGWNVVAQPDGTLTNLDDGSTHYYLFWEGVSNTDWKVEEGSVVAGKDTEAFLKATLFQMGLTPKEYNDFLVYWVPKMQENPYNVISFSEEQYQETARLTVTPKPDSLCRVFMLYRPLESPSGYENLPAQQFQTFKCSGFTVVEWGGKELA